jgi:hypothetical protein
MNADFKRLGEIEDLNGLKTWCRQQVPSMPLSISSYTVGARREKWFERGWKLSMPVEVFDAPSDDRLYQLGQRLYPGNHACLFLYYPCGAYIRAHRDHTASAAWVVQINIGCAVVLTLCEEQHSIADGEIVGFNSKVLHSVSAATAERWVISWRQIKPEFLMQQLSLF